MNLIFLLPLLDNFVPFLLPVSFIKYENSPSAFDRPWSDYHRGFGDEEGEFWLGLAAMQALADAEPHQLRVEVEDRWSIKD